MHIHRSLRVPGTYGTRLIVQKIISAEELGLRFIGIHWFFILFIYVWLSPKYISPRPQCLLSLIQTLIQRWNDITWENILLLQLKGRSDWHAKSTIVPIGNIRNVFPGGLDRKYPECCISFYLIQCKWYRFFLYILSYIATAASLHWPWSDF